jgi:TonB-dependent receptor
MMRRLPFFSLLLLFLIPLVAASQSSKGSLTGHVTDTSHAVIQRARVALAPGDFATTTDQLGNFSLVGLTPGNYTATITSIGFNSLIKKVVVTAGQASALDAVLEVYSASEQVVVSAQSGQDEIEAVNEEITAPNIVQVMPTTEIMALPNANIADAVGRLPGVTLQRDEGEGVYIQVRGLDPRLTNVTIDGVTIPSPEATVRQVNLAAIPADMIQTIELNKTLSANQDADGIGGSVNLVTKMAGDRPNFTLGSTLGYTPIENGRYVGKVDTTLGKRFGTAKRLGLIVGASYDYNGRGINDIEPSPDINPDGSTNPYFDNITLREYRFQRLRWGGVFGGDYKLNEHSNLVAHAMLSEFKDWGDKWYYEVQSLTKPKYYESHRRPNFAIGTLSIGGNHVYTSKWFTWGSAVSRSRELNSGGNPKVTYNAVSALKKWASANCNFVGGLNGDPYRPQWSPACMTPNPVAADNIYSLSNYTMNQLVTTKGQSVQLNLQEWAGGGINYHAGKHAATLEFGGEFRNAHKFQNAWTPTYDATGTINAAQFQSGFVDSKYYDGTYHMGPVTNFNAQSDYFNANPGQFSLDVTDTHTGSDSNNFNLVERITAGYIMNTINWDHFRLQTGLRLEATQFRSLGYLVSTIAGPNGNSLDNSGNWIGTTSTTNNESYIDALPSIQARWQAATRTALRAVYARGISRPNPLDLVPYANETDGGSSQFSIGNPNLKPTRANNFDLLLEQEVKPFGLIEAGFFYKQLGNPIVAAFVPYNGQIATQNINPSNANVMGLEVLWQQKFSNLPGALRGLGIMANYAYNISHTNGLPSRTDSPSLVGTAKNSYNFEPSYEYKRFTVHTGVSYNGSNIYAYQFFNNAPLAAGNTPGGVTGPLADNYFYPHLQTDAQVSVRIFRGLQLTVNGLNLNNEVFGFYNGSPQYMTQREYYKPTYSAGLRWNPTHNK